MRVAVLGGGLQGACVALELASAGVEVHLYDRNAQCLTQASACNEGKIHLGYVYAHDETLRTARAMMHGAASFGSLLRKWIGPEIDRIPVSSPFQYVVHRDSLLTPDQVAHHLSACRAIACEEFANGCDYFDMDPREPPVRVIERPEAYDDERVAAVFQTPEIGIDPEVLAQMVRARLAREPNIRCIMQAEVSRVILDQREPEVVFAVNGTEEREGYDHVVNALWDGRLAVDASAGIVPARPWLYRFKYYARVRSRVPGALTPSTTIVLGPFGDIAEFGRGDLYLSWYPAGAVGRSSASTPPEWPRTLGRAQSQEMFSAIVSGLASVVPALGPLKAEGAGSSDVKGGVIFAWGATDIDDPASGLHERASIGPERRGRYHSINTGKLTMAPLFGKITADNILTNPA